MPVAAPPPCTSTDPLPVLRLPLKIPPVGDRDPAKKSFPNPVAIPSGCHPFGSGIVSGYGFADAAGAAIAHSAKVSVRMRSDADKFPPRTRGSPRGDTYARGLWVRTVRD